MAKRKGQWAKVAKVASDEDWQKSAAIIPNIPLAEYAETFKENTPGFTPLAQNGQSSTATQSQTTATPNITWAQAAQTWKPTTPSLTTPVTNGEPASQSPTTPAANVEEHWDTHNWFGDMTKEQIAIAVAAEATKTVAEAKKDAMEVKLKGWPWKGAPPQLVTAASTYF